ncbi:MAG: efflux RND transporter periplasmic adaptor subunit [Phycisphaerae bacterium]
MTAIRKPVFCLVVVALTVTSGLWAQDRIEAFTKPSGDATLSFVRPGRVAKVLVKEGDEVKAGQELIRLDDEAELAQLEQLKAQAEDDTRVRAAEAQLAQRKVDLKQKEEAFDKGAVTKMEVEHAALEVTISDLSLELAQFQRKQDQRKYQEACIQHSRMRLKSPIDGVVERPIPGPGSVMTQGLVEAGESVDALEDVIRVVKIDPLWVDAPVPLGRARRLKRGGRAVVEFETDDVSRPLLVDAGIAHIAAIADAASGTLTVRVEAPNPTGRPAGERVYVSFPDGKETASPGGRKPAGVAARPPE